MDRAAVGKRHHIRQLAARGQVAGDVVAVGSVESKIGRTLTRIEHDCLQLEFVANKIEWRDEVRIAGDDGKCIGGLCVGIAEKRGGKIDIRPLFLNLYHMDKAVRRYGTCLASGVYGRNPCLVLVVVAFDNFHSTMRKQGLNVNVLPFDRHWIVRIGLGSRDEVLDGYEFVVRVKQGMDEHGADKRGNVKPFASGTSSQKAMIEISSVNVGYCLHRLTVKKKRSQTLRPKTSLRVGRTVRLDMNLLTGSVGSVPNRRMVRKGVCGRNSTPQRQGPDFRPALHRIAVAQRVVSNPSRGSVVVYHIVGHGARGYV